MSIVSVFGTGATVCERLCLLEYEGMTVVGLRLLYRGSHEAGLSAAICHSLE